MRSEFDIETHTEHTLQRRSDRALNARAGTRAGADIEDLRGLRQVRPDLRLQLLPHRETCELGGLEN